MTASEKAMHPSAVAQTLDELLSYPDQPFVLCAFRTLLGRDPDQEGLNYYLGRVRSGYAKIQILRQLRRSPECALRDAYQTLLGRDPSSEERDSFLRRLAKGISKKRIVQEVRRSPECAAFRRLRKANAHTAVFRELDKAIRLYQRGQLPLLGWLFRLAYGTESNHPTERKLRAIENQFFILNNRLNQIETTLSGLHSLIARQAHMPVAALESTQDSANFGQALGTLRASSPIPPSFPSEPDIANLSLSAQRIFVDLSQAVARCQAEKRI